MPVPARFVLATLSFLLPIPLAFASDLANLLPRQWVCNTPGFVPCKPLGSAGSVPVPPVAFGDSNFWGSLQSAASSPIQKIKREIEGGLVERQSGGLCCRPAPVECLYTKDQGVPFCYTPATTRMYFSDGSYAFVSNGTYYGADGSSVDYHKGQYTLANGTSGTFVPVTDSPTASSSSSSQASPTSASAKSAGMRVLLVGRGDVKFTLAVTTIAGALFAAV